MIKVTIKTTIIIKEAKETYLVIIVIEKNTVIDLVRKEIIMAKVGVIGAGSWGTALNC